MTTVKALQVLIGLRKKDQVVITIQGSSREWPKLTNHSLDFHFLPSAMGAAIPLGLGIASAQPSREVIVVSGDGSLLMNLGCLVTVAGSGATNLTVVLLDNGVYAVTGGQKTAGNEAGVDFVGLAKASGICNACEFEQLGEWESCAKDFLKSDGPRFVRLAVWAEHHQLGAVKLYPISQRVERFRDAVGRIH